jgi:hypothetical protein
VAGFSWLHPVLPGAGNFYNNLGNCHITLKQKIQMGDKSPASRQKNKKQKKAKSDSVANEKQRVIELKASKGTASPKKTPT